MLQHIGCDSSTYRVFVVAVTDSKVQKWCRNGADLCRFVDIDVYICADMCRYLIYKIQVVPEILPVGAF